MCFFKSKFDKLTRKEVVDAICKLEQEEKTIENDLILKSKQIEELIQSGKAEKSKEIRLFYAKKINSLKAESEQSAQRAMYLIYNVQLLQKLKNAIDDNRFFKKTADIALGDLLADQKGLAAFLNKTLGRKIAAEDVLTAADETFCEIESKYEKNETIYGANKQDEALLALFESEEQANGEQVADDLISDEKSDPNEDE